MIGALGAALGRGDDLTWRVVEAIDLLLREGCDRESPHAFPTEMRRSVDGELRETKVFPLVWLRRLDRAVEGGIFARRSPEQIVNTILTTEPPADLVEGTGSHG